MTNPQFPIDITANDKTRSAFDRVRSNAQSVSKAGETWDKRLLAATRPLDAVDKRVRRIVEPMRAMQDAWKSFNSTPRGMQALALLRSPTSRTFGRNFGRNLGDVANDNADATAGMNATKDAAAATGAGMDSMAASLGEAAWSLLRVGGAAGGVALAVGGAGIAAMSMAAKWDSSVLGLSNLSKNIGISIVDLQAWKAAAERAGATGDDMATSISNLRMHAYDASIGDDKRATSYLNEEKIPTATFAAMNFDDQLKAVADMIRRQPTAQGQQRVADAFGVTSIMPLIRQNDAQIRAWMIDYIQHDHPVTQKQADQADPRVSHEAAVRQALGGAGNVVHQMVSDAVRPLWAGADYALQALGGKPEALEAALKRHSGGIAATGPSMGPIGDFIARMFQSGQEARAAVGAATPATIDRISAGFQPAFEAFAHSIEKLESSGGHQFRRPGVPLVSGSGAIGATQMMPATAEAEAKRLGVPFDLHRLMYDKSYNELLGRSHLKHLYDKYQGHTALAAAAYNAGEGVVDDWRFGTNKSGKNPLHRNLGDPLTNSKISDPHWASEIPVDYGRIHPWDPRGQTRPYAMEAANGSAGARTAFAPGAVGPLLGLDLAAQMAAWFAKTAPATKTPPTVPAPPQKVEVTVNFANAPVGVSATAHAPGVGPVPVKINHSQVGRG